MREMITRIHPISVHGAQILDLQLDQGLGQVGAVAKFDGEVICCHLSA